MKIKQLSTVAVHTITDASNAMVSTIVVQVEGITADSGSMVPMQRISMSGVPGTAPTRRNCIYTNKDTGAPVAAGTPITADGFYEFDGSGAEIYMNVTAVTAGFTCYITPLEGPSGSGGGGGGVSEAVTLAANSVAPNAFQVGAVPAGGITDLTTLIAAVNAAPSAPLPVNVVDSTGAIIAVVKAGSVETAFTDPAFNVAQRPTENHVGSVGGATPVTAIEFTRPADTTAYAVNDSVNTSTSAPTINTLANCARVASGTGYFTKLRLRTNQVGCVAQFRAWFFSANNPTLTNDNAAVSILYADKAFSLGFVDFPAMTAEAGSSDCALAQLLPGQVVNSNAQLPLSFVADASKNVYYFLETKTIFTPASGQKFWLEATTDQN